MWRLKGRNGIRGTFFAAALLFARPTLRGVVPLASVGGVVPPWGQNVRGLAGRRPSAAAAAAAQRGAAAEAVAPAPLALLDPALDAAEVLEDVVAAAGRKAGQTKGRISHLKRQLQDPAVAEEWQNKGNGLNQLPRGQWHRGMTEVEITDWTKIDEDGNPQKELVELDPKKDFQENAKVCFKKARKITRARERMGALMEEAVAAEATWREVAEKAEACKEEATQTGELSETSQELVLALYQRMVDEGVIKKPTLPVLIDPEEEARQALRRKYGKDIDCYLSPNGYEVVAGRSSKMNEHVSLKLAKSDMVWFHTDNGIPGSHVLIRGPWDEVPNEDIEFAAKIAAYHSKGKSRNYVPVMYCKGHQVRKMKGMKTGQVQVSGNSYKLMVPPELPQAA